MFFIFYYKKLSIFSQINILYLSFPTKKNSLFTKNLSIFSQIIFFVFSSKQKLYFFTKRLSIFSQINIIFFISNERNFLLFNKIFLVFPQIKIFVFSFLFQRKNNLYLFLQKLSTFLVLIILHP